MTQPVPPLRWSVRVLALGVLVGLAPPARAQPEAPPDWVARVGTREGDRFLTRDRLAEAVLWRIRAQFEEAGSGPLTIFRQLIQKRVVEQEARRLGVSVSQADVEREFQELDREVRQRTNANRNLLDVIRQDMKTTVGDFRDRLSHLLLKERVASHQQWLGPLPANESAKLAQIEVVLGELLKKATIEYGIRTALQDPPSTLPPGAVARVNGEPVTSGELGEALVEQLPQSKIRAVIQEECKAVLTADWALTTEQMDAVIERERAEWHRVRELATQEVYHTLPYEDFVQVQYGLKLDNLRQDRYYRGLFGLVQDRRAKVTDKQIRADWETNRTSIYGDRYLVTDIQIVFSPNQKALLVQGTGRDYKEALRLANQVLRRIHSGAETFDQVIRDINQKKDATFFAKRISVRNTDNERILYDQAKLLQDEQVSRPFETLTEVHILRRESWRRAPNFDEVADTIRQRLAFRSAHDWLEGRMTDPAIVEIRWPPPTG